MNKPANWNEIPAKQLTDNKPIGPFVGVIENAVETVSANGNEMLVLSLDIAEGDFAEYFLNKFNRNENLDKKWPLKNYRMLSENSLPYLKGDIKAVEDSNKGFIYNFDILTLKGKFVGINICEEEYIGKDGNIYTSLKIGHFFDINKIGTIKPLKKKMLKSDTVPAETNTTSNTDYLPF